VALCKGQLTGRAWSGEVRKTQHTQHAQRAPLNILAPPMAAPQEAYFGRLLTARRLELQEYGQAEVQRSHTDKPRGDAASSHLTKGNGGVRTSASSLAGHSHVIAAFETFVTTTESDAGGSDKDGGADGDVVNDDIQESVWLVFEVRCPETPSSS
jgi:hypothetical protein